MLLLDDAWVTNCLSQVQRSWWRCWWGGCPEISKAVTFVLRPSSWLLLRLGAKENTTHPLSLIQTNTDLQSSLSLGGRKYFLLFPNISYFELKTGIVPGIKGGIMWWHKVCILLARWGETWIKMSCDIKFELCEPIHFYLQIFFLLFFLTKTMYSFHSLTLLC